MCNSKAKIPATGPIVAFFRSCSLLGLKLYKIYTRNLHLKKLSIFSSIEWECLNSTQDQENIIVEKLKIFNFKIFSDGKFVSANDILQNFLSAENFPEWKWAFKASVNSNTFLFTFIPCVGRRASRGRGGRKRVRSKWFRCCSVGKWREWIIGWDGRKRRRFRYVSQKFVSDIFQLCFSSWAIQ